MLNGDQSGEMFFESTGKVVKRKALRRSPSFNLPPFGRESTTINQADDKRTSNENRRRHEEDKLNRVTILSVEETEAGAKSSTEKRSWGE